MAVPLICAAVGFVVNYIYLGRASKLNGYVPCEKCAKTPRQTLVDDINSRRKVEKIK